MNGTLKLIFSWLAVISGAALVLSAPFNIMGAGLIVVGLICLGYGLAPILRKRKQDRKRVDSQKS